jgi:hypothetical protein
MGVIEEIIGMILGLLILLDIFLLILYARANRTVYTTALSHFLWRVSVGMSKFLGRWRELFLTLSGPLILMTILLSWSLLLALAAGLIIHPNLGTGVQAAQGETPTDFITALYIGGTSLAFTGVSDFSPEDGFFRMFFLITSIIGISLVSLNVTFLMELYSDLKERNTLGLKVHLLSAETGDAAEVVAHLGPHGQFDGGYNNIVEWSAETASVRESHHFYHILFFFRFQEPYYSVSRTALTALDTVSLIKSALDNNEYGWLKESAAVDDLWRGTMKELQTLAKDFIPNEDIDAPPDQQTRERWCRRYEQGVERLKAAGIKTTKDGVEDYISLRKQWDRHIYLLAPKFAYDLNEIDTVLAKV